MGIEIQFHGSPATLWVQEMPLSYVAVTHDLPRCRWVTLSNISMASSICAKHSRTIDEIMSTHSTAFSTSHKHEFNVYTTNGDQEIQQRASSSSEEDNMELKLTGGWRCRWWT